MTARLGVLMMAAVLTATSCADGESVAPQPETATVTVTVGQAAPIVAEVADDPGERSLGLMGRDEVPPGTGMLFVYPEPARRGFWMADVEVPLSIAWILGDRVVGVAEMQPCPQADATCQIYYPSDPDAVFDRAIEAAGGTFTAAGVAPGDPVTVGSAE